MSVLIKYSALSKEGLVTMTSVFRRVSITAQLYRAPWFAIVQSIPNMYQLVNSLAMFVLVFLDMAGEIVVANTVQLSLDSSCTLAREGTRCRVHSSFKSNFANGASLFSVEVMRSHTGLKHDDAIYADAAIFSPELITVLPSQNVTNIFAEGWYVVVCTFAIPEKIRTWLACSNRSETSTLVVRVSTQSGPIFKFGNEKICLSRYCSRKRYIFEQTTGKHRRGVESGLQTRLSSSYKHPLAVGFGHPFVVWQENFELKRTDPPPPSCLVAFSVTG
mmetsp:Transcript_13788/g.29427  ORF Transcript_13788/g.29427 Transcript_13788/m.29427 type:complete len:275 (-) Transcript_13788:221-1045(-)